MNDPAIFAEIEKLSADAVAVQHEAPEPDALAYQPFPVELLPEPICGYITASAAAIGCDPAFVGLPLLAAIASAIGNSRRIRLKRTWTEPAIIWALTIATSGSHKSPGFDSAMSPVRKRQERARCRYAEAMKRYEVAHQEWKDTKGAKADEPKPPLLERCWTDNATIEALASLLSDQLRGMLLACDELSAWFGSFDRYSSKGGAKSGDAPRWLHCHGGRSFVIDRKTGEPRTIFVRNATVSVAGAIQPGVLRRTLSREHHENGMAARFLFAMPPKRQKRWTEAEIHESVEADVLALFDRLYDLRPDPDEDGEPIPRLVRLSLVAKHDYWIPFYNEHGKEQVSLDDDLSAAWSKLEGYAARLALVHHLIRVAANDGTVNDPDSVDEVSMAAGIDLSRWFGQEAKRVYAMLSESEEDQASRELVELIGRLGGTVTVRDLQRHSRKFGEAREAEKALQALVQREIGDWRTNPGAARGGRATSVFVLRHRADVDTTPVKPKENKGSVNVNGKAQGHDWSDV